MKTVHVKPLTYTKPPQGQENQGSVASQIARCGVGARVLLSQQIGKGLMGTGWDLNHHPRPQMVMCFVSAAGRAEPQAGS